MFDVAIIGAGPAGLTAGISLAKQGFKTILLEKKSFPIDKPCGEGIMPAGVAILKKLGAFDKIINPESHYFEGIHYIASSREIQANFLEGPGLAIRRPLLSKALLEVASPISELFIEENTPVLSLQFSENMTILETEKSQIQTRFLIGADGLRSPTRHWLGLEMPATKIRRYGAVQHYAIKPWNSKVEIHWSPGLEAYITPCSADEIGVAFLWDKDRYEPPMLGRNLIDGFLLSFPELRERFDNKQKIGPTRSTGPFCHPVKSPISHRAALIGDAAGYLDPITGEGISLGLKSALLLTDCLIQNKDLSWYARNLKKSRRSYYLTTQSLLFCAKHERLFQTTIGFLNKHPQIFQRLLSLNMG
ncbi:MAG: NAD(P)/FAD-dependent oxidoreductase [Myxococcaceae bacterium]